MLIVNQATILGIELAVLETILALPCCSLELVVNKYSDQNAITWDEMKLSV